MTQQNDVMIILRGERGRGRGSRLGVCAGYHVNDRGVLRPTTPWPGNGV